MLLMQFLNRFICSAFVFKYKVSNVNIYWYRHGHNCKRHFCEAHGRGRKICSNRLNLLFSISQNTHPKTSKIVVKVLLSQHKNKSQLTIAPYTFLFIFSNLFGYFTLFYINLHKGCNIYQYLQTLQEE